MTEIPYSFTLSPPDRTQSYVKMHVTNPLRHVYYDDALIMEHLLKKAKIRNYIIYPELDARGRLHYHGSINMNKTMLTRFYKYVKPNLQRIGYVDCSPTKQILEWHIYCRKEWPYTQLTIDIDIAISPIIKKTNAIMARSAKLSIQDNTTLGVPNPV